MKVEFTINGEPQGKGRPRFTRQGRAYTPTQTKQYEEHIKNSYLAKYPDTMLSGAIEITIRCFFKVAKSASMTKWQKCIQGYLFPTKKPDLDNIMKVVCDSLNKVAYEDDCQIVKATLIKAYGDVPRIQVELEEWK
jgi:Holliday junction resolvase RusA-like endonuclease